MNYISCLLSSNQNLLLFGGDAQGVLYAWNLRKIFHEHITRKEETTQYFLYMNNTQSKNNNVYTYVCHWKVCKNEIKHLLIYNNDILIMFYQLQLINRTSTQIYKVPLSNLYNFISEFDQNCHRNPNLIDIQEVVMLNVISKLNTCNSEQFSISDVVLSSSTLYIASLCGRVIVLDIEQEIILQVIDTNKVINECIQSMVPILRNPVTQISLLTNSSLVIGSELGVLMLWGNTTPYSLYIYYQDTQKNQFIQQLRYPNQNQIISPIQRLNYDRETCQLISLHDDYISFWNIVINELIKVIPKDGQTDMIVRKNGDLVLGGENSTLECIRSNDSVVQKQKTSQDLILGIYQIDKDKLSQEVVFVRGDTPFVDVYRNLSYQFTLTGL